MSDPAVAAERTLAIVFGASRWPHAGFDGAESLAASAYELADYLTDPDGFASPAGNLLNLFDHEISQADLRQIMRKFISGRRKALEDTGGAPGDVLICYVGHGGFGARDELFLAVRSTSGDDPFESSIKASALTRMLLEEGAGLRAHVILDCGAPGQEMDGARLRAQFPEESAALLCSFAPRRTEAPEGGPHTMFAGALLDVLRNGDAELREPAFSFATLRAAIERRIGASVMDPAGRPVLHSAGRGDFLLFRNKAHPPI